MHLISSLSGRRQKRGGREGGKGRRGQEAGGGFEKGANNALSDRQDRHAPIQQLPQLMVTLLQIQQYPKMELKCLLTLLQLMS